MDHNLYIEDLKVSFQMKQSRVQGVKGISLTCPSGKKTGIVGESGSGKSLLAMSILQLLPSNAMVEGLCFYKGQNLYDLKQKEMSNIRCSEIALIPQNPFQSINPVLTIGRQLLETVIQHEPCSKEVALGRVRSGLKAFGFDDPNKIMKSYGFQMSGGMNQRILSVMGLLCRPEWVIADEPTKGLDAILRKSIYEELEIIAEKYTKSILLITHDLLFAQKFCDYIGVFYKGQMVEWGVCDEIFSNPKHPYTRALLNAMPHMGMVPIVNVKTDEILPDTACSFYANCPSRGRSCLKQQTLRVLEDGHQVRCHHYD